MKTKTLKQALITFGAMLAALLVFNVVFMVPALAQGLTVGNDLPTALAGAPTDIRALAQLLLNYLLGFLGLIAVIFIIYAGFLYVTAAGEDDNIGKAKKIIMYSIVGIIVILASAAIVNFALGSTSGASTTPTSSTTSTL
ncbi:hypothetical protein COV81_03595 [Candidatus Peregrinibacteria bacterium CG11_big_fil_rev_8_21_14_0_20_41_10]|nr:MAG: hypothetical protein COV81_03595 [Candidatus Peregrinibacteria bacterium CG11_big_fil_rev_8_21_14_0_20_41_10]PIZ75058.1 MAG: hypothetical protein COY06_03230 [Candidatus Peregrinibacteria bacterium CG_4_10_14_0_2_um_filter_41_8]PJC38088.1 MAG: hypothetical protein CO045_02070 [Candidatus Peregrinibacteria bacterium CG_4_9_14_0_2_um_filter_41_14]